MIDLDQLRGTMDLWLCMWEPEQRECFETALVRSMTDAHPMHIRALSFAACSVIATPRLAAAAWRVAERGVFAPADLSQIELDTAPWHRFLDAAVRIRGNLHDVEHLIHKAIKGTARDEESAVLDWVDPRDLVTIARTTVDARVFAEVERRIARRGRYQRGRVANLLGFRARGEAAASSPDFGR